MKTYHINTLKRYYHRNSKQVSKQQTAEIKQLLTEYRQIFSDVPTVTHLVEHKVELTQTGAPAWIWARSPQKPMTGCENNA